MPGAYVASDRRPFPPRRRLPVAPFLLWKRTPAELTDATRPPGSLCAVGCLAREKVHVVEALTQLKWVALSPPFTRSDQTCPPWLLVRLDTSSGALAGRVAVAVALMTKL